MKTRLISFLMALLFVAIQTVNAQPKALLRLNLEKDAEYQMNMLMDNIIDQQMNGQQIKILQKMEMVTSYKVLEITPDNNYFLEYSFRKMKMDMDVNGQKVILDSESAAEDAATKSIKDLTSINLKFTITPMGKVLSIEGMEEYVKRISGNQQLSQTLAMFTNEDNFKATFEQYFGYYPEKEIEVGSKWAVPIKLPALMNMELLTNFEVTDIVANKIVMNVNSDMNMDSPIDRDGVTINMKMKGTQEGKMSVDRKTGLTDSMDMNQKFDINMKFKNPQSGEDMEMPLLMNGIIKVNIIKI